MPAKRRRGAKKQAPRATHRTGDVIAVVEAAYAVDLPFDAWTRGILHATNELVCGHYGFACTWIRDDVGVRLEPRSMVALEAPTELLATVLDTLVKAPPPWMSNYLRYDSGPTRCALTSEIDRRGDLKYRAQLAAQGIPDGVNLTAADLDDFGFLISFAVPMGYKLAPTVRANLKCAAMHVLAALRLRRRLETLPPSHGAPPSFTEAAAPEAILAPDGRVLHADGPAKLAAARSALKKATLDIERVRGRRWDQPADALRMWRGLTDARWSLVDRFEEDGRRYIVARENRPRVREMSSLTDTECCVVAHIASGSSTKETAYALGISVATVRVHLMRAARRFGVRTRRALIETWRASSG